MGKLLNMLENGMLIKKSETEDVYFLMGHPFLEKWLMDFFKDSENTLGHFQKHLMNTKKKITDSFIQVIGYKVVCMDKVNLLIHAAQFTKEILLIIYTFVYKKVLNT